MSNDKLSSLKIVSVFLALVLCISACGSDRNSGVSELHNAEEYAYDNHAGISDITNRIWYGISLWKPSNESDLYDIYMFRFLDDGTCEVGMIGYNPQHDTPESFAERVENNIEINTGHPLNYLTTTWKQISPDTISVDYSYLNDEDAPITFTINRGNNITILTSLFDTTNKRYATYHTSLLQAMESYR